MAPGKGWLDWLLSEERRQGRRRKSLPLVAYYWDGANPIAHQVRDASPTGLYLMTDHRWYPGTVLAMTLQHTGAEADDPQRAISINAKVVRTGEDGVGFEFVLPAKKGGHVPPGMPTATIDKKRLQSFINRVTETRIGETKGQALVEYILLLPVVFLLIVNLLNFGGFFYAWITVADAARSGANYAALGPSSAGALTAPTLTQVKAVITAEVASLPNATGTNPTVTACQNNGTTTTQFGGGACSGLTVSADPETGYTDVAVQVVYTYKPYIQLYTIGPVKLTLPPTTITQTAIMRELL
jgi:Flp pilus assembly protein TadG